MYFENNTGNEEMDWLRTGLTDMLVTDLSQSPDVEVLSTDRLVQILGSMDKLDDRQISFDTVQEVARRAGVKHVMLGSYIKAGETIRINVKLQEAATGRIISTERVDAANEASLFPTMDDLTRKVKARFTESQRRADRTCCRAPGHLACRSRSIAISRTSPPRRWRPTASTRPASNSTSDRAISTRCRFSRRRSASIRISRWPTSRWRSPPATWGDRTSAIATPNARSR